MKDQMSDASLKDFPYKLNEWTEEEVPVRKNKFDHKTGKVVSIYEMEKIKTMYINAPKEKLRCASGTHIFKPIGNPGNYTFGCVNCPFARKVYPTTYRLTAEGRLQHRITGEFV